MIARTARASAGSLTVVGTGIEAGSHTSAESAACIAQAQKVYFVAADGVMENWLKTLNASAESLNALYEPGKRRTRIYEQIVERVLNGVRDGYRVCFVVYGHPGVFAFATHEAVRRARAEGFTATMRPGISAEDCLFAELGVDPGRTGCQSFDATDFLINRRAFDRRSTLVLWQIGAIAMPTVRHDGLAWNPAGLAVLAEVLAERYRPEHLVVVYEAARLPGCDPLIERVALSRLTAARVTVMSTLYVPPFERARRDPEMMRRLGL